MPTTQCTTCPQRSKGPHRLGHHVAYPLWCRPCQRGLFTVNAPHPPQWGCGRLQPRYIGEEVEWIPLLLCANPLGHHVPATFFIARLTRNEMTGDHYEMISKVPPWLGNMDKHCMSGTAIKMQNFCFPLWSLAIK